LSDITGAGNRQRDDVRDTLLFSILVEQVHHRLRRRDPQSHRLVQVAGGEVATHHRHQLVFAKMVLSECGLEQSTVEATVGTLETRIVADGVANYLVRYLQPQPRRFLIEQAAIDQPPE